MNILLSERDFADFRKFQNRVAKEFGENTYVGTDNATLFVEYSPEVKALLRPLPPNKIVLEEFVVKILLCSGGCKKNRTFLCLPNQADYLCEDCAKKRSKNKK